MAGNKLLAAKLCETVAAAHLNFTQHRSLTWPFLVSLS